MGGVLVTPGGVQDASFAHLLDPKRKWYNNKRSAWTSCRLPCTATDQHVQQDHPTQYLDCPVVRHLCVLAVAIHPSSQPSSLITSSAVGYDATMMNGLQSLPQWQWAFNYPSNGMLGLLNAIQVADPLYHRQP